MLNITLKWNAIHFSLKRNLALAALTLLLLLSRRWYAYYIVGFYLALGVIGLLNAISRRKTSSLPKNIGKLAANILLIAGLDVAAVLLVNPSIFSMFFGTDYGQAYSAFKTMPWWQNLLEIAQYLGFPCTVAVLGGAVLLLRVKAARAIGLRLLIATGVAAAMFLYVQTMGFHQRYLVVPTVLVWMMILAGYLLQYLKTARRLTAACLVALCAVNFSFAYVPGVQIPADFTKAASTSLRSYPVQNPYYDALKQIVPELNEKTEGKIASLYMVGEGKINPELLRRINLPEPLDSAPFVTENSTADLRDGFPSQLFMADYVLITDPFITDFNEIQQVGYQVYDLFLNDPFIESYYEIDTVYDLGDAVMTLFHKTRSADRMLVDYLKERLRSFYPNVPLVYEPNYFLALSEFEHTMTHYNYWGKEVQFYTPEDAPAVFTVNDTASFETLSFDLRCDYPGFILTVENQDGEIFRSDIAVGQNHYSTDISGSNYLKISFTDMTGNRPADSIIALIFDSGSLL